MRRRIIILGTLLLVLGAGVGLPVAAHYRAKARLEEYKLGLKAAGEKLSVAEVSPPPAPEAFRASFELMQAANLVRMSGTNYPPAMTYVGPGKAGVCWRQEILPTTLTSNVWPGANLEVAANQAGLAEVRAALQAPALAFDLNYRQGASLMLPHLARLKSVAQSLLEATLLELHEGRATNAWENLIALTSLAKRQSNEPLMISELVRVAIAAIAAAAAWETLQSSDCHDEQLKAVQTGWEGVDFLAQAEAALAMERAGAERSFAEARATGNIARSFLGTGGGGSALSELAELGKGVLENPRAGLKAIVYRYPGYWAWKWWQSYDDELANSQMVQASLEAVRKARQEKVLGPAFQQLDRDAVKVRQAHPKAGRWFGVGTPDVTLRFFMRIKVIEIQRSLLVTAIALKRYQVRHGTYPAELAALVPDFLTEIPRDPMDGQPLRYRLKADGSFLLYSVGLDGIDNGGDPTPAPDAARQWLRARDAVWPAPASPDEVKAALEKLTGKPAPNTGRP